MIRCRIITPNGLYKECTGSILNIVAISGEMGILPKHVPVVTMLKISHMTIEEENSREEYAIAGGMLYFKDDEATILVQAVENVKDIDIERAQNAKQRAQDRLNSSRDDLDMVRAEIAFKRAVNRLDK